VRLQDVAAPHRRLLKELSGQISNRLEAVFTELPDADGPNIGVALHERGHRIVMEIPGALLLRADEDATVREAIRVRIKGRRDRMLFRPPPLPLPKRITAAPDPAGPRFGFGRGPGPGRGRR
jgi:hypothetical protein